MYFIARVLTLGIEIYMWIIIAEVILSWLVAFDVVNLKNQQAANLAKLLNRATDPVFRRIRKYVPPIGGIDLTPLIVIIGLMLCSELIWSLLVHPIYR